MTFAHRHKRFMRVVDRIEPKNNAEIIICSYLLSSQNPRATLAFADSFKSKLNPTRRLKIRSEIASLLESHPIER